MTKVVVAFKDTVIPTEPDPDLVDTLEKLLADARAGTLRELAYAGVRDDKMVATGWEGASGDLMAYLAQGIMTLNHRFAKGMLGDDG